MYYNYSIPYYNNVIPYRSRQFGSFLIPFGLGLVTGPLVFNPRPRPNYYYPRPRPLSKLSLLLKKKLSHFFFY